MEFNKITIVVFGGKINAFFTNDAISICTKTFHCMHHFVWTRKTLFIK